VKVLQRQKKYRAEIKSESREKSREKMYFLKWKLNKSWLIDFHRKKEHGAICRHF